MPNEPQRARYDALRKDQATPMGKQLAGADVIASFRRTQPNPPPAADGPNGMSAPNHKH